MPEVGVLNLSIRDNSKEAGKGLDQLADALVRVRDAVNNGFDLTPVANQVTKIASIINGAKGASTVVKNLGTMFNAITNFSKIKSFNIPTQPFEDLKKAIGDGFKIGTAGTQINALRNAMSGEWGDGTGIRTMENLHSVVSSFAEGGDAKKIKDLSAAVDEYSESLKNMNEVSQSAGDWRMSMGYQDSKIGKYGVGLQQFARKAKIKSGAEQMKMDLDKLIGPAKDEFVQVESVVQKATDSVEDFNVKLVEIGDTITSIKVDGIGNKIGESFNDTGTLQKMQEFIEYIKEMYSYATKPVGRGTWADIAGEVEQANSSAETFYHTVERTNELVQNMKWQFQDMWRTFQQMFNQMADFFSSRALGSGVAGLLGAGGSAGTGWQQFNPWGSTAETGWTYWKEGAIEAEGTVSEVIDDVQKLNSPETLKLTSGQTVFSSIEEAAQAAGVSVEEIRRQLAETYAFAYNTPVADSGMTVFSSIEEAAKAMGITVEEAKKKVQTTMDMLGMTKQVQASVKDTATTIENAKAAASQDDSFIPLEQFLNTYSHLDYLKTKLGELERTFDSSRKLGILDANEIDKNVTQIIKLREEIEKLEKEEAQASSVTYRLKNVFGELKSGIGKVFPTLTALIKRFGQIVKYRMLRAVLKHITSGFSEGMENVYNYSKLVGTDLAPAMDSAASAFLQFKNSIGAAVAPLVQAFIPVINQVVSVVITAINYVNQFFALLNGQKQWTRALPATTTAFNNQTKAAKGASAAMKDLLADWDELNIIQSETNGGAGGGSGKVAEDYLKMFEEVGEFDSEIRDVIKWIQDHFEGIKGLAEAIGVSILAWKLSSAFLSGIEGLQSLVMEGVMITAGLQLAWAGAYNAGLNGGFDVMTGLETAGGVLMTTVGAALIGFRLAGPWGAVVGGAAGLIASVAVAIKAYYDGERTKKLQDKWGTLHLTQDEINDLVDEQVTAPVLLALEVMDASIQNRQSARLKADMAIMKFSTSLTAAKFMLEANNSDAGINDALETAKAAIDAIQVKLNDDREGLTLSFTKFKYKDKEGNDITTELYSSLMEGNLALDQFFTDMGNDIATYISKGFSEGLSEEEQIMALDLMETLNNITNTARMNYEKNKLVRDSERDMSGVYDIETAKGVLETQKSRMEQYKSTVKAQMDEDLESNYEYLEYFKEIRDYFDKKGNTAKVKEYEGYISDTQLAIDNLEESLKQIRDGSYLWYLDESYSGMVNRMSGMWREKFAEWYKDDFYRSMFDENIESPFDNNPIAADIMHEFGMSPYELLDEEEIANYFKTIIERYNGDLDAALQEVERKHPALINEAYRSAYFTGTNEEVEKQTDVFNEIEQKAEEVNEKVKDMNIGEDAFDMDAFNEWKDNFDVGLEELKRKTEELKEKVNQVTDSIEDEEDVDIWELTGKSRFGHIAAGGMSDMGMGRPTLLGTPEDTTAIAKSQEQQTNRFFGTSGKVMVEGSDVSNGVKDGTAAGFQTLSAKLDMLSKLDTTNQLLRQIARAGMTNGTQGTAASVGFGIMQGLNAVDRVIG